LGRGQLEAITDQLAGVEVDDAALDAATTHVHAESPALRTSVGAGIGGG
jgi:hypothetical protein